MFQEIDLALLHFFNGSQSAIFDQFILTLTNGLTWIPLYIALFVMVLKNNESMSQIFIIVGCCAMGVIFSAGVDDLLVKPLVGRPRPAQDLAIKYTIDTALGYRESGFSFFSAHASNTMSIAVFFSLLVRSRLMTFFMIAWSLLNCWTRMYLGLHYPGDIMVGLIWGTTVGSLVYLLYYHLYLKIGAKLNYVSTQYTSTGYALSDVDMVITVLMLTCCVAVMCGLTVIQ